MTAQSEDATDDWSQSEIARVRVVALTLILAVLTVSMGMGFASAEQYQWIGKGGRSVHPSAWSAFVPRAAIWAFSPPYAIVAAMALLRVRATGRILGVVVRVMGAVCIMIFALPSAYFLPSIVWTIAKVFAGGQSTIIGLAESATLLGILWTWRPLLRAGDCLHRAWVGASNIRTQVTAAAYAIVAYIAVWIVSLIAPAEMERSRLKDAEARRAEVKAAERARIPVGAPLALAWRVTLRERPPSHDPSEPPGIAIGSDGIIYAALADAVVAIDPTGRVRWTNETISCYQSRPVPDRNGLVYIGGRDGVLHSLRAQNGFAAWQMRLTPALRWSTPVPTPAIASDGSIYAGASGPSGPTQLYRLLSDGRVIWHVEVPGELDSPAILDRGDTAIMTHGRLLSAIAPDGRTLWTAAAKGWMAIPLLLPDRSIGLADGERIAILSRTGGQVAQQTHASAVWAVDDTTALFATGVRLTLRARMRQPMNADTLPAWRDVWNYNAIRIADDEHVLGVALMSGGRAAVSTQSRVVILRLTDAHPIAEFVPPLRPAPSYSGGMLPPLLSAPVLGSDGTIYVAGTDQSLYALRDTLTR